MEDPDLEGRKNYLTVLPALEVYSVSLTLARLNKDATPTSNFQPIRLIDPGCWYKFKYRMANKADPDQLASSEASWSWSTLFAKAGYILVQQDKG